MSNMQGTSDIYNVLFLMMYGGADVHIIMLHNTHNTYSFVLPNIYKNMKNV